LLNQLRFTLPEILALVGLAQSLYVIVYMGLRAGDLKRAILPFLYFLVLGAAFFLDFAQSFINDFITHYELWQWGFWFMGPPLSVLLILQIAQISQIPRWTHSWVLILLPLSFVASYIFALQDKDCNVVLSCAAFSDWLVISGLCAGAISMLAIWANRSLLRDMASQKLAKERYWLIVTLIFVNLLFLAVMLMSLTLEVPVEELMLVRTVLGVALVYLAGTSLFRIYPQAVQLSQTRVPAALSRGDQDIAKDIERLMDREKVYHEPSYSRADLARELKIPETVVSRVINNHFGKTFPQILNERRIEDAKRLLVETDAAVKVIAGDTGFNSIASFNRVFKDITGLNPSEYRKTQKK